MLVTGGYTYKGHKPVMWSPVEGTALAEAEIEYDENHESTAVYVKYLVQGKADEFVVIWTTTTWTLPSSLAVCFGEEMAYVCITPTQLHEKAAAKLGEKYWVAKDLQADFCKMIGAEEVDVTASCAGGAFAGWVLSHPFYTRDIPMFAADHVTTEQGTGFVHTAPMHGQEDYAVGVAHGLDTECHVDGDGNFDQTVQPLTKTEVPLTGCNVLDKKTHAAIVEELTAQGALLRWYKFKHKYPISWRSKAPLIFRTTPQWFVALDNEQQLRKKALEQIDTVNWVPGYGRNRIYSMIENRPDWCISRQRVWGVPITIFRNTKTGDYIKDEAVFSHIAALIEKEGIDAWELRSTEDLLPQGWLEAHNLRADELEKETDILDVWFDSGTTHAHVLRNNPDACHEDGRPADLYFEGSDQHRGWFHSSLLTSVANYGEAPYHTVVTNGFTVDGDGKKMSKSIGNVVAPADLTQQYGMDIIRLWVASSDYSEDIRFSDEIIKNMADAYRKFRNTFRYLLGNLHGFDAEHAVAIEDMPELEKYILIQAQKCAKQTQEAYDKFQFHRAYRTLYDFCAGELSNRYFDIRKDALYCDAPHTGRHAAVQTVLWYLFDMLATHLAPLLPFTTDEAWRAFYGDDACVHLHTYSVPTLTGAQMPALETAFALRDAVNMKLEEQRAAGNLGHPYQAHVHIGLQAGEAVPDAQTLAEICVVSAITFTEWDGAGTRPVEVHLHTGKKCPRCWTYHAELTDKGVCERCDAALDHKGNKVAA
jgi:isoleucyl-tRNA synthetase